MRVLETEMEESGLGSTESEVLAEYPRGQSQRWLEGWDWSAEGVRDPGLAR